MDESIAEVALQLLAFRLRLEMSPDVVTTPRVNGRTVRLWAEIDVIAVMIACSSIEIIFV